MLRGIPASPARVFACSQHVRTFTLSHLKHVTCSKLAPSCSRFCAATSHCCSAGTSGFDRACIRPRPSWTSWVTHLTPLSCIFSVCGTSSGTSAPASLSLLGHTGLLRHSSLTFNNTSSLVRLLLPKLLCHWSGVLTLAVSSCVLFPIPGCFSFFTSIWHVFQLLPQKHGCRSMDPPQFDACDVTCFRNTQARNHNLPRATGMFTALSLY